MKQFKNIIDNNNKMDIICKTILIIVILLFIFNNYITWPTI